MTESTELTCKLCHREMEFKKELSDGYCFDCSQKIADSMEQKLGSNEANLLRDADKKWLQELQKGKTAAKYAGKSVKVPASFYRERKMIHGID